ncbi:hypothetical protein EHS13_05945 [Paenibacillus psychroresistens]|uniref:Sialate O-acetylesterase domain-containing protein n=1 Tax=Paenibacillus psychroresistens TaxID=1778678 RepID=A0A6B8RGD1_9BACL|nr:sialate O-acetylesterase [Paenibacillus psychroresistens]QGQ94478.1 hypothetical protein EHS13_05945 [Paenibacillus psychroresistens]
MKPLFAGVTIVDGPEDWQIIQRDKQGFGSLSLIGTWETQEQEFSIQARLVNESNQMPVTNYLDWQTAALDTVNKQFRITLNQIPQGGLYRIETRIRRPNALDARAMRGDCIHHIGIGDLYIIAGQSNASGTGKGEVEDGPMLGVHMFANDERWKLGSHPLEDATNTLHPITITSVFHGHSPWIAFAKAIFLKTSVPIGLIPTALGGSPISMWIHGEDCSGVLFDNMAEMLEKAGGKAAGLVWHQGESDTSTSGLKEYKHRFQQFVAETRKLLQDDAFPIFTAQLNGVVSPNADDFAWSEMRQIQRELSLELGRVYLIVTIGLGMSDEIHNSSLSNVVIGQRYASAALEHVYGLPISSSFPDLVAAAFVDEDKRQLQLQFAHVGGDWTPHRAITDFRVEDELGHLDIDLVKLLDAGIVHLNLQREPQGITKVTGLYGANPRVSLLDDNCRGITPFIVRI